MAELRPPIQIPVAFIGAEDIPVLYANQFVVTHNGQEFILVVGQITPPLLLGTPEQQAEQAKLLSFVPIKTVARFAMTRERMEQLIKVLQEHLKQADAGG